MGKWTELRGDDDDGERGKAQGNVLFDFDLDFLIEKYRFDPCKERLRSLFDQLLGVFLKDISTSDCIRPIPALCGDGQPIDLLKLFWVVRKIGGHEEVSRNNLWGFVSRECGLGAGVAPSVELIHDKYLKELDQWLRKVVCKGNMENEKGVVFQKLDLLSREIETRFGNMLQDGRKQKGTVFFKDVNENELHLSPNGGIDAKLLVGDDHCPECIVSESQDVEVDIGAGINGFATRAKSAAKKLLAKSVVKHSLENTVKEANASCKEQVEDCSGKSYSEDDDYVKKVTTNALNCERTISGVTTKDGRSSVKNGSDVHLSAKKVVKSVISKTHDLSEKIVDYKERVSVHQGIDNVTPAGSGNGTALHFRKRKRESQSVLQMLHWLASIAKNPNPPSVGKIPECSKWSDYGDEELWIQVMSARKALLIRRHIDTNTEDSLPKDNKQITRMHPSMYQDDFLVPQTPDIIKCSKRVPDSPESQLCPCFNSNTARSKTIIDHKTNEVNSPRPPVELALTDADERPKTSNAPNSLESSSERKVSVGPPHQAFVPKWSGVIPESDSKWLGTRMWAPPDGEKKPTTAKLDPVGKGRPHSCDCPFPNSVECIRFHIAEKRLKLKREIGAVFYRWRFDRMGEEVSLSWTEDEEKRFKDMMRSYASFPKKFWENAFRFLPCKTRENLVSYYFNVFLVNRRSYQNRVTPTDVDSDDDEREFGSVGGYFGYKALYLPGTSSISCSLNKESYELV